jgi:uncharacterized membrane protein
MALNLPDQIPTHIGPTGLIDAWGSKWIIPFFGLVPFFILLSAFIYNYQIKKNKGEKSNVKVMKILFPILLTFMTFITWIPVYIGFQYNQPIKQPLEQSLIMILTFPLGLIFIIIGNYLGIIKKNRFVGIKTPWTLRNEHVWQRTHRFGSYSSVLGGLIIAIGSLVSYFTNSIKLSVLSLLFGIFIAAFVPMIYSYIIYRKIVR